MPPQLPGPKHIHLRKDNNTAVACINKKEGYTLPCSDSPSPGTIGSCLGCLSIPDSTAHSRHTEYSSRYNFQADRDQNRMDLRQTNLPIDLSDVFKTRSGSLCIPLKSPSAPECFDVPESGSTSGRCLSPGLSYVGLSNPPPCRSSSTDFKKYQGRADNFGLDNHDSRSFFRCFWIYLYCFPSCTHPCCPSHFNLQQNTPCGDHLAVWHLAGFVTKQQAFQRKSLTPYWRRGQQSPRGDMQVSARHRFAGVLNGVSVLFRASLVTLKDLEYKTVHLYKPAISQDHDPIGSS